LEISNVSAKLFGKPNMLTEDAANLLASIVASSDEVIISKDLNGIITTWNDGARRVFGYSAEEIVGKSILLLIPEDLRQEEDHILAKIRAGERVEQLETTRIRNSGERFSISITVSPIRDNTGRIIGASKVGRDISERLRADEHRARLAAIVDSADDAIIAKNLNGIITSWNRAACFLFGYTEDEIIGKSILILIPEDLHYEEEEILRKLRAGQKIDHYETTRVAKDGTRLEVSVTISPLRNRFGEVIGASKIARDISERKKIERLLIQSEKVAATGRMAAAVAHEINNPLSSVLNLIFLARQDTCPKAELQTHLAMAESELERVSHIARQTLGYYRDTGSPKEVHIHDLIENVLSVYRNKTITQQINVETSFNDLRKIRVWVGEMIQVFSNLVSNAIDALPEGGTLSIETSRTVQLDGDGIRIVISDTGRGIRREHLSRVFEPFFTTKGNLGTGIGLWIAKQLVERHEGQISISSSVEPDNSGTTVSVFLPFESRQKLEQ
jgi:PAS domain S-box-containing protein